MSAYEWGALGGALLLLALVAYGTARAVDAYVRWASDPDRAFRRFLAGRWWT